MMSYRELQCLLVDDDEVFRFIIRREIEDILTAAGVSFSMEEAGDGPTALSYVRANTVDVIVLDYEMPGMMGTDVLRELKMNGIQKVAIGLTRYEDASVLAHMVESCALKAFCKDFTYRGEFLEFVKTRALDLIA